MAPTRRAGENDGGPLLRKGTREGTEENAVKVMHPSETGGKDVRGVRAIRHIHQDGATTSGCEGSTQITTGTSHRPPAATPRPPTEATPASAAPNTRPGAPTYPAARQKAGIERTHRAAAPTRQQRLTPATTPSTARCPPSHPTRGRSRRRHQRDRPTGGRPAGRTHGQNAAKRRARPGARAATSRRATSTRTARRPSRSWTS